MSATAAAPATVPAAPPHAAPGLVQAPRPQQGGKGLDLNEDVPAVLNRLQILAVVACLVFAAGTGSLLALSWHANAQAADNTEQLVRVQGIETNLLRADALATNAFLAGGIESQDQTDAYDAAIDSVTAAIADAARAQSADGTALAALNTSVSSYITLSTQARDNNRQGFPIASEYLRDASAELRTDALPIIDNLVKANQGRAQDSLGAQHTVWVIFPGLVALIVLWLVNRELRLRFRRTYNGGIFFAWTVVGVLTVVSVFTIHHRHTGNDDLRSDSYQRAVDEAQARTAGNDAKSDESQDLIEQGGSTQFSDAFSIASQQVLDNASVLSRPLWEEYLRLHDQVTKLAASGQYDAAVTLATGTGAKSPTAALDAFDTRSRTIADEAAGQATHQLRDGNSFVLFLAVLAIGLGLIGALLSVRGISARRREYS